MKSYYRYSSAVLHAKASLMFRHMEILEMH